MRWKQCISNAFANHSAGAALDDLLILSSSILFFIFKFEYPASSDLTSSATAVQNKLKTITPLFCERETHVQKDRNEVFGNGSF